MPFNAVPAGEFINRESELAYLLRISEFRENILHGNIVLEGARGIGKTELLTQFYSKIFWEHSNVVPFYYSFRTSMLRSTNFSRDYFSRFVRQYIACLRKNPSLAEASVPTAKLMTFIPSLGIPWMMELIDNFERYTQDNDPYGQILTAISAPVTAVEKSGNPVLVILDEFHLASRIYETRCGDSPGVVSFFEESVKNRLCRHVIAGSPEGIMENLFADTALRGKTERMVLGPLPENAAVELLRSYCSALGLELHDAAATKCVRMLRGNPFYIGVIAKAFRKMQKRHVGEKDLVESYSHSVTEGDIEFYWSTILAEYIRSIDERLAALKVLMHLIESNTPLADFPRLSGILDIRERDLLQVADGLRMAGLIQRRGDGAFRSDTVLRDFIRASYMREVEGLHTERIRETLEAQWQEEHDTEAPFEMVIPMTQDAELVAAKAAEQIGKNLNLSSSMIDSIKLALIESCINAIEHSGSYDRKVLVKFSVSNERLMIFIDCEGKPFDAALLRPATVEEKISSLNKRGWGFQLMHRIMDEVKVERVGDKTRVILIKQFSKGEVLK